MSFCFFYTYGCPLRKICKGVTGLETFCAHQVPPQGYQLTEVSTNGSASVNVSALEKDTCG